LMNRLNKTESAVLIVLFVNLRFQGISLNTKFIHSQQQVLSACVAAVRVLPVLQFQCWYTFSSFGIIHFNIFIFWKLNTAKAGAIGALEMSHFHYF
jgi:hypothetical protein